MRFRNDSVLYRFYKLRARTGVIFSLPLAVVAVWYAWSAYAGFDRYRDDVAPKTPLDLELFHVALHDELSRDLRRMRVADRPEDSALDTFSISLTRENLDNLHDKRTKPGNERWVDAFIEKDGKIHDVRMRLRGGRHWHWLGTQKSMKVRLKKGDLLDGTRVFNLINGPSPFGMEQQLIFTLARELGLLTPEHRPVWVRLNNSDLGVFQYHAQPEEGLLRRSQRMPGNLFSGDSETVDESRGVGDLFFATTGWKKVAWRNDEEKDDLSEIEQLNRSISTSSHREFAEFAAAHINLDKYATFDALDVIFGGNDHDYFTNHKLYVDPYTGKMEPVAWAFQGFHHETQFNLVENPLLLRLKMTPGFVARRDAVIYKLLTTVASVAAIRERVERVFASVSGDLAADPYWDAYKVLPFASRLHRFMVRPMNRQRWMLAAQDDLDDFERRSRYLLDELERPGLKASWKAAPDSVVRVDLVVDGHAAYRVTSVSADAACQGRFRMFADVDADGRIDPATDTLVAGAAIGRSQPVLGHRDLTTGIRLVALERPSKKAGKVRSVPSARHYSYLVATRRELLETDADARDEATPKRSEHDCVPTRVTLELENVVTGFTRRLVLDPSHTADDDQSPPDKPDSADDVPAFEPGASTPHEWQLPPDPKPSTVVLGPGPVEISRSRTFFRHETVTIEPGTKLVLDAGVSLTFLGPVHARGTRAHPIEVAPKNESKPFGGLSLQGPGTRGSRLHHVNLHGGTHPKSGAIEYPATVNIHATSDIVLGDWTIQGGGTAEDIIHANTVDGLTLQEVTIRGAKTDAVDIEISTAEARGLRVFGAGDDCLDLMTTTIQLIDSVFVGCTNNGISAGEESKVTAHSILVGHAKTGLLAKNASQVLVSRSVIYDAEIALRTKRREIHYDNMSFIGASELAVVDCEDVRRAGKGTAIDSEGVQLRMPQHGSLDHLLNNVLNLQTWGDLASFAETALGRVKG